MTSALRRRRMRRRRPRVPADSESAEGPSEQDAVPEIRWTLHMMAGDHRRVGEALG